MRHLHKTVSITDQSFRASNLYRVLPQSYKDLSIFSNSAFTMLPHKRYAFYFQHLPVGTYCIGTDSEGIVNRFQRDYVMSVRQVVEEFGKLKPDGHIDWSNFNEYIKHEYLRGNYHSSVMLSNIILPNPNPIPDSLLPQYSMNYVSYNWIRGINSASGSNVDFMSGFRYSFQPDQGTDATKYGQTDFVSIKGYQYFPVIANRWEVAPNSDYGIDGPAELALGEILSLQDQEKDLQEGIAKIVKPPMVAPAKMRRHHSSVMAGSITYVDEESQGTKYRAAFDILPSLGELLNSRNDYRAVVRKAFYEDLFLMMNSEQKISHVTAEEIRERASEKLVGIGPALGQIDQDQNSRLISNALLLQSRIPGRLPQTPESLREQDFRPEYISILAQAQKATMISSQNDFINFVVNLSDSTGNPALKALIKGPETIRARADFLGVNPNLIATEEEYQMIVEGINQKAAQAETLQQQNMASSTVKNLAGAKMPDGTDMLQNFSMMAEKM